MDWSPGGQKFRSGLKVLGARTFGARARTFGAQGDESIHGAPNREKQSHKEGGGEDAKEK